MSASLPKCAISIASHILLGCTKPKKLSMHWAALECHKKESKLHREQKVWINKTENPFKLIFQTKNSLKLKNLDVNFVSKKGKQANLSGPVQTQLYFLPLEFKIKKAIFKTAKPQVTRGVENTNNQRILTTKKWILTCFDYSSNFKSF